MSFRIQNGQTFPIKSKVSRVKNDIKSVNNDFQSILESQLNRTSKPLKISTHAQNRMEKREIHLNNKDLQKLEDAVYKLEQKGSRESLMLYKNMAFITNIKNRTIITAMNSNDMDIVTNIDSAVFIK